MVEISKKVQEGRLRWYGHLLRREDDHVGRSMMDMEVQVRRRRGRPRKKMARLCKGRHAFEGNKEETQDRNQWRRLIQNGDPI